MAIKSEKLNFESTTGEMLAARLDLPAGEPKAYALFAHCFTCSKDIFAAQPLPAGLAAAGLAALLAGAFARADDALLPGSPIYVAHPAGRNSVVFVRAFVDAGWRLHQTLVWVKDSIGLGPRDYRQQHNDHTALRNQRVAQIKRKTFLPTTDRNAVMVSLLQIVDLLVDSTEKQTGTHGIHRAKEEE